MPHPADWGIGIRNQQKRIPILVLHATKENSVLTAMRSKCPVQQIVQAIIRNLRRTKGKFAIIAINRSIVPNAMSDIMNIDYGE